MSKYELYVLYITIIGISVLTKCSTHNVYVKIVSELRRKKKAEQFYSKHFDKTWLLVVVVGGGGVLFYLEDAFSL